MRAKRTLYAVLGIAPDAPDAVVRAAYRALAKQYHPDTSDGMGDTVEFVELQNAYEVLSDPERRAAYDLKLQQENSTKNEDGGSASKSSQETPFDWERVRRDNPYLSQLYTELKQLSEPLADRFANGMAEKEKLANPELFARELESSFLNRYFGPVPYVQFIAKELLKRGQREAAKELSGAYKNGLLSDDDRIKTFVSALRKRYDLAKGSVEPPKTSRLPAWLTLPVVIATTYLVLALILSGKSDEHLQEPAVRDETSQLKSAPIISSDDQPPQPENLEMPQTPPGKKDASRISSSLEIPEPETALSSNNVQELIQRLRQCWTIPAGAREAGVRVKVMFNLDKSGAVVGQPEIINAKDDFLFEVTAQSAIAAIMACQKYDFLPAAKYDAWKTLTLNFDPNMF